METGGLRVDSSLGTDVPFASQLGEYASIPRCSQFFCMLGCHFRVFIRFQDETTQSRLIQRATHFLHNVFLVS
jgi:hypothetical protein